jgi:REP element-mobilizing transposase RayT
MKEKTRKFGVRLTAWVILENHYHLLFHVPSKETLASFMGQINGRSSYEINRLDGVHGRSIWYQYWDKCPRDERDLYSFFNYIHINPLKHGEVHLSEGVLEVRGENWRLNANRIVSFHEALAQYPYSSYPFYLRKYGESALTHAWMDYPIPVSVEGDEY